MALVDMVKVLLIAIMEEILLHQVDQIIPSLLEELVLELLQETMVDSLKVLGPLAIFQLGRMEKDITEPTPLVLPKWFFQIDLCIRRL